MTSGVPTSTAHARVLREGCGLPLSSLLFDQRHQAEPLTARLHLTGMHTICFVFHVFIFAMEKNLCVALTPVQLRFETVSCDQKDVKTLQLTSLTKQRRHVT